MALTRKMLKAMGIEEDKIDQIIEAHAETVDALKDKLSKAEESAEKLSKAEKELENLKAGDDYKAKYEAEHQAFEDFKNEQTAKAQKAAKEQAARAYFESKGITGANLEIAMMGAKEHIASLELDGESIKDNKPLADLVKGTFSGLVVTQRTVGANPATPPANNGGAVMSRDKIFESDERGNFKLNASERQEALQKLIEQKG